MDTHDVSSSNQYFKLLERQKGVLQAARARQGERPHDRQSRTKLVNDFMLQHVIQQMKGTKANDGTMMIQSSFIPPPYPPSTAPLKELTQTFIKDLKLETHHRGKYLLVRSLTPPNKMTAVMAIVVDEREDAIVLQIYQQDVSNDRPATSVIKQDDVFAIKEPYFKVMADGGYGLRIDHVSDLIRVEAHDEKLPMQWRSRVVDEEKPANDWKLEGNDAMKKRQYWIAIESYTAALACPISSQEEKPVKLNRALAYLKEECFDAALADTECLTSFSDAPEKALYRASQALYKQGRFSECQEILTLLCKKYPKNIDATKELARVSCRLEEQRSGIYDFKAIYQEASKLRPPHLDHATFTEPVMVKASKGRGRGLFTTKAVKAGDLLLCEKAFAHCYASNDTDDPANSSKISLLMNMQTNRMHMGAQSDLITKIVQKLLRNPSCLPQFTALHHGSYKPVEVSEVDGKSIIDTFLVEQIISLNSFGCPLTTRSNRLEASPTTEKSEHHSCGIWLTASTINHSCLSNTRRSFIGDLQIVRATRDLAADTELTFWYRSPMTGSDRHAAMQEGLRTWAFECDCAICLDAANTPSKTLKRRDVLYADLKAVLLLPHENMRAVDAPRAERLLAALDRTYKAAPSTAPRLRLWDPYLFLARCYAARDQSAKAASMALKMLESLGFIVKGAQFPVSPERPAFEVELWGVMTDYVVEAWILLCTTYGPFAPHMARKARECARVSYRICFGEDVTFDESYS